MRREAVKFNKRSRSGTLVATNTDVEDAELNGAEQNAGHVVAEAHCFSEERFCPCLGSFDAEDEHYAVSEHLIEHEREASEGNWLNDCSADFSRCHGTIVEGPCATAEEEDSVDTGPKECQLFLAPGICRKDLRSLPERFRQLGEHMKNLLRWSRGIRRSQGYVVHHILVLWCEHDDSNNLSIKDVMLLTRVSYSPFDATALQFVMTGEKTAKISVDASSCPKFIPLASLLVEMSRKTWELKTATYQALSLSEIQIDVGSVKAAGDINVKPVDEGASDSDGSDSEDCELEKGFAFIKNVIEAPHSKTKKMSRKNVGQRTERKKTLAVESGFLDMKTTRKTKKSTPEQLGVAGEIDQTIASEWLNALESELGPAPAPCKRQDPGSGGSGSVPQVPAVSSSSSSRPSVPIVSRVYPWRDDNGYCWKYSENSGKAKHLGLGVFTCSHSLKEWILTFDGSCHMLLCQIEREGRITEIKQGQPGHAVSIRCSQMLSKDRSVSWNDV